MAGPKPRVISLSKCEGQSYGFFLRVEQGEEGHLIRALEMGGPAELAGLRDGDRIIRVNGTFVDNLEHSQVTDLVKKSGMTVAFHVLGEEAYKQAKHKGINLADPQSHHTQNQPIMNGVSVPAAKLKLCFLQKSSSGFGFSLKSTKGGQGLFMIDVIAGGAADKAGVKGDDRLVEINGENVERSTHDQVVDKIKASGDSVMFLLVDEDADKYYKSKCIPLVVGLATVKYLPKKPRITEMTKGSNGYGYFLKADPKITGHFVGEIDRGSPAERAGLKEMDRVAAVEGEDIDHCSHEQLVEKIQQLGNRCCLLVVDTETDKMYKMGAASPLLYWEEMRSSLPKSHQPEPEPRPAPAPTPPSSTSAVPAAAVPAMPPPAEETYKPKICRLEKTAAGFGFHLNGIQGVPGQYIKEVVKGGAADRAGLEDDDIVVEVNGVNVEKKAHEEVVNLIRSSGDMLVLLVASKEAYDCLKAKGVPITPQLLTTQQTAEPCAPAIAQEEPTQRAANPTPQSHARTTSVSSSSSSPDSEDEKF